MAQAVISVIGHDRPGLVSDISSQAKSFGMNIEDSRMTVLGGEFAVLMALDGEDAALDQFKTAMEALCGSDSQDLAFLYRPTQARETPPGLRPYIATVVAMDHPGIVAAIAQFFTTRKINIRDLRTDTSPAAHTGTPIFNVTLVAEIPADARVGELKRAFEAFCDDEDLDGELEALR